MNTFSSDNRLSTNLLKIRSLYDNTFYVINNRFPLNTAVDKDKVIKLSEHMYVEV